jgi:protein-S-isoprenylcysteine O-methyltransferase Ste14
MEGVAALPPLYAHALYGAAWVSFALGHSALAGERLKRVVGPGYRLAFNLIAAAHIAGVFAVGRWALGAPDPLPVWAAVVHGVGWAGLLIALKDYDLGRFSGLAQIRAARAGRDWREPEALHTGGLHRYVRHPLYAGALLILWGGAPGGALGLATAAWGTAYLAVGAAIEERRLLARYGAAYGAYRRQVPAVLPWKGRAI